jgi:type VI protein secretion system component VasK
MPVNPKRGVFRLTAVLIGLWAALWAGVYFDASYRLNRAEKDYAAMEAAQIHRTDQWLNAGRSDAALDRDPLFHDALSLKNAAFDEAEKQRARRAVAPLYALGGIISYFVLVSCAAWVWKGFMPRGPKK